MTKTLKINDLLSLRYDEANPAMYSLHFGNEYVAVDGINPVWGLLRLELLRDVEQKAELAKLQQENEELRKCLEEANDALNDANSTVESLQERNRARIIREAARL